MSFDNIARGNPFSNAPIAVSPTSATPRAVLSRYLPSEIPPVPSLPSSRSEPNFQDFSPSQPPAPSSFTVSGYARTPSTSPHKDVSEQDEPRGRGRVRAYTPHTDLSTSESHCSPSKPVKRSRSPVKRLLGIGKSTPNKEPPQGYIGEPAPNSSAKRSLKEWTSRFKNGFVSFDSAEEDHQAHTEERTPQNIESKVLPAQSFPISLDPSYQSRLIADLELMVVITANRFLIREAKEGRISPLSIAKVRHGWEEKNRAQVVEYQFDQGTQRRLILENLGTVNFCGDIAHDHVALTAALYAWGVMANEMLVRTFCAGDSVIRKWLNDIPRLFEMLGAPYITFQTFEKIQTKTLLVVGNRQRAAREGAHDLSYNQDYSLRSRSRQHSRNVSNDSYIAGLYGSMDAQIQALDWQTVVPAPAENSVFGRGGRRGGF